MSDQYIKEMIKLKSGFRVIKRSPVIIIAFIFMMFSCIGCAGQSAKEQGSSEDDNTAEQTEFMTDTETETEKEEESNINSEQEMIFSDVEDEDIRSALIAYREYIDQNIIFDEAGLEQWNSNFGGICTLLFVDNDDIPECLYYGYYGMPRLLWYKDGQVLVSDSDSGSSSCYYQKETGKFCFISQPGGNRIHTFMEFSSDTGSFLITGMAHTLTVLGGPEDEPYYAILDDNSAISDNLETSYEDLLQQVSVEEYESYISSFGEYIDISEQETLAVSVEEAYKILQNEEG